MQPTTSSEPTSPLQPLVEALVNFHKTVPAINKTAKAQYGNFADLETVLSTVTPHLIKNGLVVSQGFEPNAVNHEGSPVLTTRLIHVSGAEIVSRLPMIIGKNRNPLHDFGGSCTYSRRYSLLAILGLTADMDVDGDFANPAESAPAKPAAKVEGVADKDQPLSKGDRELCLGLIQELSADNLARFCKDFRRDFGLASDAKIAPVLTGVKHQNWMNENLKNYV
jgi:hypothetical protein